MLASLSRLYHPLTYPRVTLIPSRPIPFHPIESNPILARRLPPVLVIAERMVDLAVPLHHTWTYQALLHDLLDMRANRVKVAVRQCGERWGHSMFVFLLGAQSVVHFVCVLMTVHVLCVC